MGLLGPWDGTVAWNKWILESDQQLWIEDKASYIMNEVEFPRVGSWRRRGVIWREREESWPQDKGSKLVPWRDTVGSSGKSLTFCSFPIDYLSHFWCTSKHFLLLYWDTFWTSQHRAVKVRCWELEVWAVKGKAAFATWSIHRRQDGMAAWRQERTGAPAEMGEAGGVHQVPTAATWCQEQAPPLPPNMLQEGWLWGRQADTWVAFVSLEKRNNVKTKKTFQRKELF